MVCVLVIHHIYQYSVCFGEEPSLLEYNQQIHDFSKSVIFWKTKTLCNSATKNEVFCGVITWKLLTFKLLLTLTLPAPGISESCIKIKSYVFFFLFLRLGIGMERLSKVGGGWGRGGWGRGRWGIKSNFGSIFQGGRMSKFWLVGWNPGKLFNVIQIADMCKTTVNRCLVA